MSWNVSKHILNISSIAISFYRKNITKTQNKVNSNSGVNHSKSASEPYKLENQAKNCFENEMKISKKIVKGNEIQKSKGKLLTILKAIFVIMCLQLCPFVTAQKTLMEN